MIRISLGTADVLGLKKIKTDALPTTAYMFIGEKCVGDCSFCPQAKNSNSRLDMLSRITWPDFDFNEVLSKLSVSYDNDKIRRVCIQVVNQKKSMDNAVNKLEAIKTKTNIPVCLSCNPLDIKHLEELFDLGADRISIALDAACERVFKRVKGEGWNRRLEMLEQASKRFPGKISTHLIVGLGETENEMLACIDEMKKIGVKVALFAFTPIRGTKLEDSRQPDISSYRRIQLGKHLIEQEIVSMDRFVFEDECVTSFGIQHEVLVKVISDGKAFQTSGCPDCNRPYYNEKPGGVIYNYPRPLTEPEIIKAIKEMDLRN
ncbi:biotin synthase [Desulfitispora alkaliphila]|uniref:radical SAM protein n=1 Tax=Desulfitispora alkaliphila TaxID=622674 RepID=UPI003D1F07D4